MSVIKKRFTKQKDNDMRSEITRRQFKGTAIQSLLTFSLLETLFGAELFAKDIRPVTAQWLKDLNTICLLYTSPSPRDQRGSRMPSSA